MKRLLIFFPLLLILSACSGNDGTTEVSISLRPAAGQEAMIRTVACPGVTPTQDRACREIFQINRESFSPVPPGTPCTRIYGGPEELEITGTIRGQEIDAHYWRSDGCELERWNEVAPLVRLLFAS